MIRIIFLLCISFSSFINAEDSKMSGAFRVFPIDNTEISSIINGENYQYNPSYHPSGPNVYKSGFEIILPEGVTKKGYLVLISAKTQNTIYRGHYTDKQTIIFDSDYRLLDQEGGDLLRIEYFDFEKKLSYICEQEKDFKLWEVGSIATINILPTRKLDEDIEGLTYCYEANIYKKINDQR